jgi:hypothetical protein
MSITNKYYTLSVVQEVVCKRGRSTTCMILFGVRQTKVKLTLSPDSLIKYW